MVQLCVRVDEEVAARLDAEARRAGLRRSDVMRQAILERLRLSAEPVDDRPLGERMRHLIGCVHSDIPDLGERHRDYLQERFLNGR